MALSKIDIANMVTGATPVANGGTGLTSGTSGQFLKFTGSTTLASAAGGGITEADQWRLNTTDENIDDDGEFLTTGWERNDSNGYAKIGTGMSQSSGEFSFPSTGIYKIEFVAAPYDDRGHPEVNCEISVTLNNSSYNRVARSNTYIENDGSTSYNLFTSTYCSTILDVTDISQVKVKFHVMAVSPDQADSTNIQGNTSFNQTTVTFTRLGDT